MRELSAATRSAHLEATAERTVDVLVIGGGATGAGVAWDAATRGLSVALVEREDFAAGTSGRSSRLVHGGARYLRYGDFGVVAEGLRERRILLGLAPHLIRPLGFLVPEGTWWQNLQIRVGLALYDALALGRNVRRHRRVSAEVAARVAPTLRRRRAGLEYWDCATDDARLVLEVIREAAAHGALVANHAEVEGVLGEGTIAGALVQDRVSGGSIDVRARMVVNATGAWADRIRALSGPGIARLRPSKGVHLVVPRERLPVRTAVLVPSLAGGMIFVIPWGPRTFAGTTDSAYHGDLADPPVEPADASILLASLNRAFAGDLSGEDVVSSWAGVRPLLASGSRATRDLSRRHVVVEDPPGLITVTGGKLTAFRAMAEDIVDLVCRRLRTGGPSRTRRLPIGLHRPLRAELARAEVEASEAGLSPDGARRLLARYGDDWVSAVDLIRDDPALGEPMAPDLPVLRVEVEMARRREMAITDDDVLIRRTRLATMDARAAAAVAG
jgi:glycerol-3-phosphate dehydrogenase